MSASPGRRRAATAAPRRRSARSPARAGRAARQTRHTDAELDALLPSEGYEILSPPPTPSIVRVWWDALFWSPTLPLWLTWPLVLTSVSWYAVSWFALRCAARAAGDPVLKQLALMQVVQATCSVIHWLRARSGTVCALDKVLARASFAFYTLVAVARIRDARLCLVGWPLWVFMVACYRCSLKWYAIDGMTRARWVVAHASFHVSVGVGQCILLHGASSLA